VEDAGVAVDPDDGERLQRRVGKDSRAGEREAVLGLDV
jgi:hypothetical protein